MLNYYWGREKKKLQVMHKIQNNYAPEYLSLLRQSNIDKKSDYKLRAGHNVQQIKTKKIYFHTSFFPSIIQEWNNLSAYALTTLLLEIFKSRLKIKINFNKTYLWHNDSASIKLSCIQMALSALNEHLNQYLNKFVYRSQSYFF